MEFLGVLFALLVFVAFVLVALPPLSSAQEKVWGYDGGRAWQWLVTACAVDAIELLRPRMFLEFEAYERFKASDGKNPGIDINFGALATREDLAKRLVGQICQIVRNNFNNSLLLGKPCNEHISRLGRETGIAHNHTQWYDQPRLRALFQKFMDDETPVLEQPQLLQILEYLEDSARLLDKAWFVWLACPSCQRIKNAAVKPSRNVAAEVIKPRYKYNPRHIVQDFSKPVHQPRTDLKDKGVQLEDATAEQTKPRSTQASAPEQPAPRTATVQPTDPSLLIHNHNSIQVPSGHYLMDKDMQESAADQSCQDFHVMPEYHGHYLFLDQEASGAYDKEGFLMLDLWRQNIFFNLQHRLVQDGKVVCKHCIWARARAVLQEYYETKPGPESDQIMADFLFELGIDPSTVTSTAQLEQDLLARQQRGGDIQRVQSGNTDAANNRCEPNDVDMEDLVEVKEQHHTSQLSPTVPPLLPQPAPKSTSELPQASRLQDREIAMDEAPQLPATSTKQDSISSTITPLSSFSADPIKPDSSTSGNEQAPAQPSNQANHITTNQNARQEWTKHVTQGTGGTSIPRLGLVPPPNQISSTTAYQSQGQAPMNYVQATGGTPIPGLGTIPPPSHTNNTTTSQSSREAPMNNNNKQATGGTANPGPGSLPPPKSPSIPASVAGASKPSPSSFSTQQSRNQAAKKYDHLFLPRQKPRRVPLVNNQSTGGPSNTSSNSVPTPAAATTPQQSSSKPVAPPAGATKAVPINMIIPQQSSSKPVPPPNGARRAQPMGIK